MTVLRADYSFQHRDRIQSGRSGIFLKMKIELLINFDEFWSRLSEDIGSAQQSVFVQSFAFEGDAVGRQLSAALLSSPAPDRRILADSFTRVVLSDRFRYSPANLFDRELRREGRGTALMMSRQDDAGAASKFTNPYA